MKGNVHLGGTTVDPREIDHFTAMAEEWWSPSGKFRPLHEINPVRLGFIRDHIAAHFSRDITQSKPLSGITLLDIGCGGGLMCEPLTRLGAEVTGVDAAEKNIRIAALHAQEMELDIAYRHDTAEALAAQGLQYDVVMALEIIEHVADVEAFLRAAASLVKPGGLLFLSTINRTLKAYAFAIIGAEYMLRWLPRGTHHWKKFLRPSEIILPLEQHEVHAFDLQGMVFDPINRRWFLKKEDTGVNYLLAARKIPA